MLPLDPLLRLILEMLRLLVAGWALGWIVLVMSCGTVVFNHFSMEPVARKGDIRQSVWQVMGPLARRRVQRRLLSILLCMLGVALLCADVFATPPGGTVMLRVGGVPVLSVGSLLVATSILGLRIRMSVRRAASEFARTVQQESHALCVREAENLATALQGKTSVVAGPGNPRRL